MKNKDQRGVGLFNEQTKKNKNKKQNKTKQKKKKIR